MKARFFYAPQIYNTWPKLFVLTEDGKFYSEFLEYMRPQKIELNFNFDTFKAEHYLSQGYQPIKEVDEKEAKDIVLKNQDNWIERYLQDKQNELVSGSSFIRLNKIARDFEVGIPDILRVLDEEGIKIDSNPNTKIPTEYYDKLKDVFSSSDKEDDIKKNERPKSLKKGKLGFTNFRRFPYFAPIEFNEITYLVGSNNSGKSTFVKALMIVMNYLKSDDISRFDLRLNNSKELNIGSFDRAKCQSEDAFLEDVISFDFSFNIQGKEVLVIFKMTGSKADSVLRVLELTINLVSEGVEMCFYPVKNLIEYRFFKTVNSENDNLRARLNELIEEIESKIDDIKDKYTQEYIQLNSELTEYKESKKKIKTEKDIIASIVATCDGDLRKVIEQANLAFNRKRNELVRGDGTLTKEKQEEFVALQYVEENKKKIEEVTSLILDWIGTVNFKYLSATLEKQNILFPMDAPKGSYANVIDEYFKLGIYNSGNDAERFVNKWISGNKNSTDHEGFTGGFEIGNSLSIEPVYGTAHTLTVTSDKSAPIPIADKGTGAIQALLLILKIANVIDEKMNNPEKEYIIAIEEPELTLHPLFQSRLCDMFYEAHKDYGIRFIVETHSEYLIRKSQLIVLRDKLEKEERNPFSVIYFDKNLDKDEPIWNMIYGEDGSFRNNFGKGFYDEASNRTLDLMKLRNKENG